MIPSSLTACRGFVLRKVRGVNEACRLLVTSTGHRVRTASLLRTALVFLVMIIPMLAVLALSAIALHTHPAAGVTLAFPMVAQNPKAAEFRVKPQAIRDELLDDKKTFTKDEIEEKAKGIAALEARAAYIDEMTPAAEIERQGGDEELRKKNPDSNEADTETLNFQGEIEKLANRVRKT